MPRYSFRNARTPWGRPLQRVSHSSPDGYYGDCGGGKSCKSCKQCQPGSAGHGGQCHNRPYLGFRVTAADVRSGIHVKVLPRPGR